MQKHTYIRGFTLIELMVAMTIGLFIIGGIVIAYTSSKQTYRVEEGLSRLQENGRYALETISRDIRMADYNGCYSSTITPVNTLNSSTAFAYNFAVGIEGNEATSGSAWAPTLDTTISGASPPPLGGTDVITVRIARGTGTSPTSPFMGDNAASIHVDTGNGIMDSDILLISDCSGAAIFQATDGNPDTSGTVAHNLGASTPGNATKDLGKTFKSDAEIMKLETVTYYIAPSALATGNNSLWRKSGTKVPEELAEGVDNLQILYGEDTDADLTANKYVKANSAGIVMKSVMSVQISLLMRTTDNNLATKPQQYTYNGATVTPTDRRVRKAFTTVVNLRNHTL